MTAKLEVVYQLWLEDGDRIEVGRAREGHGLIEIREFNCGGETAILLDKDLAKKVSDCLICVISNMEEK